MNAFSNQIQLVGGGGELPDYPISSSERLDSHYFIQWNMTRWRASEFRRRSYNDLEVGFFGFELFCLSQDETPVGTLPCDEKLLAFMLHAASAAGSVAKPFWSGLVAVAWVASGAL